MDRKLGKTFEGDILNYTECDMGKFLMDFGGIDPHFQNHGLYKLLNDNIDPDLNVLEIGSHIGQISVFIAKRLRHGKLICMEPQKQLFTTLSENIDANNLTDKCILINKAGDDTDDDQLIHVPQNPDSNWANLREQALLKKYFDLRSEIDNRLLNYIWVDEVVKCTKVNNIEHNFNFIISRLSSNTLPILKNIESRLKNSSIKMLIEWYPQLPNSEHLALFTYLKRLHYTIYRITKKNIKIKKWQELKVFYPGGCWVDLYIVKE